MFDFQVIVIETAVSCVNGQPKSLHVGFLPQRKRFVGKQVRQPAVTADETLYGRYCIEYG